MNHFLAFFNAGCEAGPGGRRAPVVARKALRRLMWPFFSRLYDILIALVQRFDICDEKHERLVKEIESVKAGQWDKEALSRRLATLEDRVEALTAALEGEPGGARERERSLSICARLGDDDTGDGSRARAG
jgi:hypothetical protein